MLREEKQSLVIFNEAGSRKRAGMSEIKDDNNASNVHSAFRCCSKYFTRENTTSRKFNHRLKDRYPIRFAFHYLD